MIIPTAEFDPMFADDGVAFRIKMIEYIRREFSDLLVPGTGGTPHEKSRRAFKDLCRPHDADRLPRAA